jgi:Transcriptional regulatory protein, C terminal/Queuosine biosynthesis protein QueC
MSERRHILCGAAPLSAQEQVPRAAQPLRMRLGRAKNEVHLNLEQLTRPMCANPPDVVVDLLEIAAYVYAADQAVTRGGKREFDYGAHWRRRLQFEIPVRKPEIWRRRAVMDALTETLTFLTDDDYEFSFTKLTNPARLSDYLFGGLAAGDEGDFEEVVLFSGGLDSLAGAVQEILRGQRKVALVSHRPVNKIYTRQCDLVTRINGRLSHKRLRPLHVAVEVNKGQLFGGEFTQRARSFLFAAVAAATARLLDLTRIRFYENGVVSLNLPLSPQVLGGRATRTTHPKTLRGFGRLFSLLFDQEFRVENPFQWETKASILQSVKAAGHADLCAFTSSCAHTFEQTIEHPNCGRCSQCVDRRLTVLAAGLSDVEDPPERYGADVLIGARQGEDLILIERYIGTLLRTGRILDARSFLTAYPEMARVLSSVDEPPEQVVERARALYALHADQVKRALGGMIQRESDSIVAWRHPADCLLSIVCGRGIRSRAARQDDGAVGAHAVAAMGKLVMNAETFKAELGAKRCPLGNTIEFHLLARLNRRPGIYVSLDALRTEVWHDGETEKNAIQRTVSNVRRKLHAVQMTEVVIDGSQPGHYQLRIEP